MRRDGEADEHTIALHLDGPQSPGTVVVIVIRERRIVELTTDSGSGPRPLKGVVLDALNSALAAGLDR